MSDGQYPGVVIRNNIDQADINMIRFLEEQVKGEHGASDCTCAYGGYEGAPETDLHLSGAGSVASQGVRPLAA